MSSCSQWAGTIRNSISAPSVNESLNLTGRLNKIVQDIIKQSFFNRLYCKKCKKAAQTSTGIGTYSLYLVCFSGCFRDHEAYSLSLRLHHINLTSVLSMSRFYKLVLSWFSIDSVLRCTYVLTRIQHVRCAAEVLCFVYVMMGLHFCQ